jgi:hypothetical protein
MADEKVKLSRAEKLYENAKDTIINMSPDMIKAAQGNKAAGQRVRKSAQAIKKLMLDLRKETLLLGK